MKLKFKLSPLKRAIVSAIALGFTILGTQSHADTGTSTMIVSASSALHATATVISTCTSGAAAQITMNAGAYEGSGSTDVPVRRMNAGASEYLVYQVYSDVTRETVWGNTVPTGIVTNGTGSPQTHKVYGSIPSAQLVPEGDYSDQIIVTITY